MIKRQRSALIAVVLLTGGVTSTLVGQMRTSRRLRVATTISDAMLGFEHRD